MLEVIQLETNLEILRKNKTKLDPKKYEQKLKQMKYNLLLAKYRRAQYKEYENGYL